MTTYIRVQLLTGNKRLSVKRVTPEVASNLVSEGKARLLQVQTTSLNAGDVITPEDDVDPTCKGTTASGASCGRRAGEDGYCFQHAPEGE